MSRSACGLESDEEGAQLDLDLALPGQRRRLRQQRKGTIELDMWLASSGQHLGFLELDPGGCIGSINRAANDAVGGRFGDCTLRAVVAARLLEEGMPMAAAGFREDGARVEMIRCWHHSVVTTGTDGKTKVWNTDTGACVLTLEGDGRPPRWGRFSSDGAFRAEVAGKHFEVVHVFCTATGSLHVVLKGHANTVMSAHFSPDGERVASASCDRTARVWSLKHGTCITTLVGHEGSVNSAAFSPDGYYVVTSSTDGTARMWSVGSGECVLSLRANSFGVNCAAYSADGLRVVTGSDDRAVRIWSASSRELLQVLEGHESPVMRVQL